MLTYVACFFEKELYFKKQYLVRRLVLFYIFANL